jgi:DNA-binding LacI/PurR family transcriptional regulator
MKSISLLELAKEAGVSKTTVSLVLNGKAEKYNISRRTIEKVLALAREKNYKPNILARSFSMGKSMTIGFVMKKSDHSGSAVLMAMFDNEVGKHGYRIIPAFLEDDGSNELTLISDLVERGIDAVAFFRTGSSDSVEILKTGGILYVLLDPPSGAESDKSVMFDAGAGVRKLIGHWYTRSKRTIGYIGKKEGNRQLRNSYRENYIERFSMKGDYLLLLKNKDDDVKLEKHLQTLLQKGVNAIMFESPDLAYRALKVISDAPAAFQDVSFGSYGYDPAFDVAFKKVIYVDLPFNRMAEYAAGVLMRFSGKSISSEPDRLVEPELVS